MILEILLGLLVVIFITESYVIWNLLNKVELLETWVEDFSDRVGTWEEIKTIDSGHFESMTKSVVYLHQSNKQSKN